VWHGVLGIYPDLRSIFWWLILEVFGVFGQGVWEVNGWWRFLVPGLDRYLTNIIIQRIYLSDSTRLVTMLMWCRAGIRSRRCCCLNDVVVE
jgi:hypothetical protein